MRALSIGMPLLAERGFRLEVTDINGQSGAVAIDAHERVFAVMGLDIADGRIQTIHSIANPDKLQHLGQTVHLGVPLHADRRNGDDD